jgi:hypothetical protein
MDSLKSILKILLIPVLLGTSARGQEVISSTLFGQNAWFWQWDNTTVSGTGSFSEGLDQQLQNLANGGVKYVRIGGIDGNFFPLYDFNPTTLAITNISRLTHLIDGIRGTNPPMQPIIQVSFNPLQNYYDGNTCGDVSSLNNKSQADQATIAANLVNYLNNSTTGVYSSNPITYWIISNEPDLGKTCSHGGMDLAAQNNQTFITQSAATISSYFKEFSKKMKDKDDDIIIIGPELAMFGNDNGQFCSGYCNPSNEIMNQLVSNGTNSIMGTFTAASGNTRYYCDWASVQILL